MKKREKAYSVALASMFMVLFLIFVSFTTSASPNDNDQNFAVSEISGGPGTTSDNNVLPDELSSEENDMAAGSIQPAALKITETRITTHGTASNPDIYGDKIVWQDNRNGNWDVYIYDLSAKTEIHTTNKLDQMNPAIYGNLVVWEDQRNGGHDIYVEDLSAKKQTRITTSGEASTPDIYGNKIVYVKKAYNERENWYELYMYDLSTKKETQIPTRISAHSPSIYGNKIVWLDFDAINGGDYYIYMYDLSTKTRTQIAKGEWGKEEIGVPDIYNNRIVYEADRNGNWWDIYMYDLSTKKEIQITSSQGAQTCPAIYGNRILWEDDGGEDDGNTNHGIYMYDISTTQKVKISAKGSAYYPAIYGNNIVWQYSDLYETGDIYMGTLSNSPVAAFSASPTSGNVPLKVKFIDKSTGTPTSWKWSFGDGKTSTSKSSSYTYSKAGKYTVSLTVKNAAGTNTKTVKDYITVKAASIKPVAAFSATPTSGKAPLKVQFTDKSTNNPTSWKWSFGDGTYSTAKSPAHTYSKVGKYTVSLTVKNAAGSNTKNLSGYITVSKK